MQRIFYNGVGVYLDFAIGNGYSLGVISVFDRSLSAVKGFTAGLSASIGGYGMELQGERFYLRDESFDTYIQPVTFGKEKFYHGVCINKAIGTNFILCTESNKENQFYDFLMKNFDLPLMREWSGALYRYFRYNRQVREDSCLLKGEDSVTDTFPIGDKLVPLTELKLVSVDVAPEFLSSAVSELFKCKEICISKERQKTLAFEDMDSYFKEYGHTLVENLEKQIYPLRQLDGEAHDFTLKSMRLYPQQLAQVNGDVALLEAGNYAILNHGMGTGKTISAAAVCESYAVRKWLKGDTTRTLKDAYETTDAIKYRNIIMCPGHLVQKWADEIKREVPYASVTIISDFSQLVEIRKAGIKRTKREYFVLSKDFCKLSYQSIPSPSKVREGVLLEKECVSCGRTYSSPGHTCPYCGDKEYRTISSLHSGRGMVCPNCNRILLPYAGADLSDYSDGPAPLKPSDFAAQNARNSKCYYCEEELWQPHVANLSLDGSIKEPVWQRATHYANKTHKGKKTVWVHKTFSQEYFDIVGEAPLSVIDGKKNPGVRKYAPSAFIKKYLKGYFDIAIFDEVQDLKGGYTGQGHAMHCLVKASKKQLALTGTIAGGMASHLFYTLFRLDPARMKAKGFSFSDELKFSEAYGKVERQYEYRGDETYRSSCKGKQIGQPKVKPGISPLIFMDFLLDRTTFLDLSDMSKYLPKLKETVVSVVPEERDGEESQMLSSYRSVIDSLKAAAKEKGNGGLGLLSQMLQFSLSYPDKPFGVPAILSPTKGTVMARPDDFTQFMDVSDYENLTSKEKRLCELVRSEQAEGRNVVIYAEYTGSPVTCVSYRLKEILETHCHLKGQVAVLESTSPKASEREAWMHKQAAKGIKVFITNPRCVATGLDFCFKQDGVQYNYPTLIFYQLGYSLFTIWQASRRHFRLIQKKECRTYYMAWAGTAQEAVISLIAEKQAATSAIQGKFSTEGLAAMANGVDTRMKLAQALSNMDAISGNGLQEMFDVLADSEADDGTYSSYKPMQLIEELLGRKEAPSESFEEFKTGQIDLFNLFSAPTKKEKEVIAKVKTEIVTSSVNVAPVLTLAEKSKKTVSGQFALF